MRLGTFVYYYSSITIPWRISKLRSTSTCGRPGGGADFFSGMNSIPLLSPLKQTFQLILTLFGIYSINGIAMEDWVAILVPAYY